MTEKLKIHLMVVVGDKVRIACGRTLRTASQKTGTLKHVTCVPCLQAAEGSGK